MQKPKYKSGKYYLPLFRHPLPRVLKFDKIKNYIEDVNLNNTVLDYGAGDQPYRDLLENYFTNYVSADYAPSNQTNRKSPDIYISSQQTIELNDGSINCVLLTEVLEHVSSPDNAIKEIKRVLCENGSLIGSVPFFQNEHEVPFDYYRYTYFGLKKLFENNGLSIVKLEYIGGMFGVLIVLISKFLSFPIKGLNKIHLNYLGLFLSLIFKIPEYIYLYFSRRKFFGLKLSRLSTLPLGFTFYVKKIIN